jgi:hypothetical protein
MNVHVLYFTTRRRQSATDSDGSAAMRRWRTLPRASTLLLLAQLACRRSCARGVPGTHELHRSAEWVAANRAKHLKEHLHAVRLSQSRGARACGLADVRSALRSGSAALREYMAAVYGDESDVARRKARERWFVSQLRTSVEVLWLRNLPRRLLARCSWPALPSAPGSVYTFHSLIAQPARTLWVYRNPGQLPCTPTIVPGARPIFYPASSLWNLTGDSLSDVTLGSLSDVAPKPPSDGPPDAFSDVALGSPTNATPSSALSARYDEHTRALRMRARLNAPAEAKHRSSSTGGWIEVTHRPTTNPEEERALWMYRAVGSGLWFNAGLGARVFTRDIGFEEALDLSRGARPAELPSAALGRGGGALGADTFVRNRCEVYSPAPRIEIATVRFAGSGVRSMQQQAANAPPGGAPSSSLAFMNCSCAQHFSTGWPPGAHPCRCKWLPGGVEKRDRLGCANHKSPRSAANARWARLARRPSAACQA